MLNKLQITCSLCQRSSFMQQLTCAANLIPLPAGWIELNTGQYPDQTWRICDFCVDVAAAIANHVVNCSKKGNPLPLSFQKRGEETDDEVIIRNRIHAIATIIGNRDRESNLDTIERFVREIGEEVAEVRPTLARVKDLAETIGWKAGADSPLVFLERFAATFDKSENDYKRLTVLLVGLVEQNREMEVTFRRSGDIYYVSLNDHLSRAGVARAASANILTALSVAALDLANDQAKKRPK